MVDILSLLKNGDLLGISIGSSAADVHSVFGDMGIEKILRGPDERGPIALLVGGFEFHLFDDRIFNILLKMQDYWYRRPDIFIGFEENLIYKNTSISKIVKILYLLNIGWRFYQKYCEENRVVLITEGSATIEFVAIKEKLSINRIHRSEDIVF